MRDWIDDARLVVIGAIVALMLGLLAIAVVSRGEEGGPWVTVLMAERRIVVEDAVPDDTVICFDSQGRYCPTVGELRADGLFVLPERGGR